MGGAALGKERCTITGDTNWPRKIAVFIAPSDRPRSDAGTVVISHWAPLGMINPVPNPHTPSPATTPAMDSASPTTTNPAPSSANDAAAKAGNPTRADTRPYSSETVADTSAPAAMARPAVEAPPPESACSRNGICVGIR